MNQDSIYRKYHQGSLTFSLWYAFSENFVLALSHDEVVHGKGSLIEKMSGDTWQKMANLRLLYAYMFTHPGKKLTFMGMDIGQWREWNHDKELDWFQLEEERYQKFNYFVKDLHRVYKENPSLFEVDFSHDGFQWIDFNDSDNSIVSYTRKGKKADDYTIIILNFTPIVRDNYRVGVPENSNYEIIFNSDSEYYGGSNVGNNTKIPAVKGLWQQNPYSINLTIPPLGALILKASK
jgi:1,4-alpha-glucan branching enzyme